MRSVRLLALASAVLVAAPAFAQQEEFPDVPRNHWAFAALARMKKDGLLVGYPDSLYRGGRPASRYELAVALHAAYTNLKNFANSINTRWKAVPDLFANSGDKQAIKDGLDELAKQLAVLKGYSADIADLRRASDTFELELTQLGVDAQAMKDSLKVLDARVRGLEAKRPALDVSGRIDLWVGGGHTASGSYGLNRDGRVTGTRAKGPVAGFAPVGIDRSAALLHEVAVDLATSYEKGVNVRSTLVASNAFGANPVEGTPTSNVAFGNQSDLFSPANTYQAGSFANYYGYAEGPGDVYLQTLAFTYTTPRADFEAGRIQHQATPWVLRRIDNTSYFSNPRWDGGDYTFDGLRATTRVGSVGVEVYGGSNRAQTTNGVLINPLRTGPINGFTGLLGLSTRMLADRLVGGTLTTNFRGIGLRADALVLRSDFVNGTQQGDLDGVQVYGGEADYRFGRFRAIGGLRESAAYRGDDRVGGAVGNAWDARLAWSSGRLDLWAQYREVQNEYVAPGDWGRLGVLRNPTNVRGALASARVGLTPRLGLQLEGEISHGLESLSQVAFFDRGTDIGRYAVRLDSALGCGWGGYARYEQTMFRDLTPATPGGTPRYQWYGVGVSRELSSRARFSLDYEQSAIHDDFQLSNGADFRGGFLTSQVTIRF